MMKRWFVVLLLLAPGVLLANLTGRYQASMTLENGDKREMNFAFIQDGDHLGGYVSTPRGNQPIVEGQVSGEAFTFVVRRDGAAGEERITYQGKITSEGVVVTMPGFGGRPPRELVAQKISSETPKPLPPAAPKILLPAAEPVPYNGLAKTPPMGWNSWNKFESKVNESGARDGGRDGANGMRDAGYIYVNIDDTWEGGRDARGTSRPTKSFRI